MPTDTREEPRKQPSAPVEAPASGEPEEADRGDAGWPVRQAGDERGDRGDRMPRGADEPGAGL